ncbi:putative mucin/carbohydrate-binding domain-containing protein, partial [Enterococcus faecalis]
MKKKLWLSILFVLLGLVCCNQPVQAEVITKTISSLEEATWVFQAGTSRARYHDRQDLGVVMSPGSTIKIRKKNTDDGYKNLTLWFLGNNKNEEQDVSITTEWKTIDTAYAGVPFINTPYGVNNAEIEYEITGPTTPLPIYQNTDTEQTFFDNWDTSNAAFSLVKGHNFQLLIPLKEKEKAKKLKSFTNLNEYTTYQEGIIDFYDEIMGLTSEGTGVNKKPQNRFFLKADSGVNPGVGAYYGSNYAANGASTVTDMWMSKNSWGTLHEIGHAYQPSYNGKGIYTGEVSNNLLCVFYLSEHMGQEYVEKSSWLFNYGNKTGIETNMYQKIWEEGMSYSSAGDHRLRLVLLTSLVQTGGPQAWAKLNQEWREAVDQKNVTITSMQTAEYLNYFYSKESQQDFTPVFLQWGVDFASPRVGLVNRNKEYAPVVPLASVVPKELLANASKQLGGSIMDSIVDIASNNDLKKLGLPGGSLKLHFEIDDFNQLKGKTVRIKDGKNVVKEVTIESQDMTIDHLDNGVYSVAIPRLKDIYEIDDYYAYIRDAQNEKTITLKQLNKSTLLDETINYNGLSGYRFATFKTNFNDGTGTFDVTLENPHAYYSGELYASMKILDEKGETVFSKDIEGTAVKTSSDTFPLKEGYKVVIYHAEIKRMDLTTPNLLDTNQTTNTLLVKNGYLMNVENELVEAASDLITFKGYNNKEFATIKANYEEQTVAIDIINEKPHTYYGSDIYASIQVHDDNGTLLYEKTMQGKNVSLESMTVPLKENYTIKIFHDETKTRLDSTPNKLIDKNTKENILIVKNGQLINVDKDGIVEKTIGEKIDAAVAAIQADPDLDAVVHSNYKDQIYLAILTLPIEVRDEYLEKYQDFLAVKPGSITINYQDETGKKISESVVYDKGRFGESLNLRPKIIDGYEYVAANSTLLLKYKLEDQERNLIYKK